MKHKNKLNAILNESYSRTQFFQTLKEDEELTLVRDKDGKILGIQEGDQTVSLSEYGITEDRLEKLDQVQELVLKRVHQRILRLEKHAGIDNKKAPRKESP